MERVYDSSLSTAAELDYDDEVATLDHVRIVQEGTPSIVAPNNYFALFEMQNSGITHRFVNIGYEKEPADIGVDLVHQYETVYSPYIALIMSNILTQENVRVLPPEHEDIDALIS